MGSFSMRWETSNLVLHFPPNNLLKIKTIEKYLIDSCSLSANK